MSFKIISDSSSNIVLPETENYSSVPLKIMLGNEEFVDDKSLNVADFIDNMSTSKEKCTTSCPNVYDWLDSFKDYKEIFCLTISNALSGSYTAAVKASEDYLKNNKDAKIEVINTLSTGPEMELIIEKLEEFNKKGYSFEQAKKEIKEYCSSLQILFSLESLRNLAKNGRVNSAVAKIAGILGIRVVGAGSDDGKLEPLHKCRGEKKAIETIVDEIIKRGFKGGKLRIAHCENLNAVNTIKEMILKKFSDCDIKIRNCTGLCSFYAERGGFIIGFEA